MSKDTQAKQKHMTQDDRIVIEKGLDASDPLSVIAGRIEKDPTTIAKEVKKHRTSHPHNAYNESPNRCALAPDCHRKNLCELYAPICKKECRRCPHCHKHCPDYLPFDYHCKLTDRAPFVCNGCKKKSSCRLDKYYYRAATAHRQYKTILVESRTGLNISEEELTRLDQIVSPLIRQGQSVYMILQAHPEITQSEKTIYNYISSDALSVKDLDLPKKVKYKVRNVHKSEIDDKGVFEGRTYKDFQAFIEEFPDTRVVEMDTVLGCEGSRKVLLTLHFSTCHLMVAYLLESKESKNVEKVFDLLEQKLGALLFCKSMPLILTDRGGEFKHPDKLECSSQSTIRTSIYYCDPLASWQKPHCEKNHVYIRKICPKGKSTFDRLTQNDVALMMDHINNAARESLGGLSPLALAKMMLPRQLLDALDLKEIPSDEIILTPALLKGKIEAPTDK